MAIKKGSLVKFHYTGHLDNGEKFGSTTGKEPIECKIGEGRLLKGVEKALMGMKKSEKKGTVIYPENAYGKRDKSLIQKVPKNITGAKNIKIGQTIKLVNKVGRISNAQILAIESDTITLDFNHPLAGKVLKLNIEVVDIK